jgi:DNA-binding NarL/FixJ family response regulator
MVSKRKIISMSDYSSVMRTRKLVSFKIKYKIIQLAHSGESNTKIAQKLELPHTTVVSIMKIKLEY